MNNFISTEKSLKRWLKNRVTVTTATVVGFLIAGTVVFGESLIPEIPTGEDVITIDQPDKQHFTSADVDTTGKKIIVNGENTNNGAQTSSAFSAKTGITLTNKGEVWVTDNGKKGYAQAMGNNYQNVGKIINEGKIYVDGKDIEGSIAEDRIKGMAIDAGEAFNRGIIVVTDGVGMTDNSGTSEKTIINDENGRIVVEGTGAGIYHRKEAITKGSVENRGTIEVTGKGTGVLIANDKAEDSYNGKSFTNSGTIIANNGGKAINSSSKDFTLNLEKGSHIKGVIELSGENNTVSIDGVGTAEKSEINKIQSNDVNVKINNSNVILEGKLTSNGTVVELNNKEGNNTLVNKAVLTGETGIAVANTDIDTSVNAENRLVSITNEGDITAKYFGINNNGYYTKYNKIEIANNGKILVNDFIKTTSSDKPYYYNTGIYSVSAPYTKTAGIVRNTKEVKIDLSAEQSAELKEKYTETNGNMYLNIHGIRLHEHTEGYNTGDIIVNSFGGIGVALTAGDTGANKEEFKERYGYFENNGTITVTGEKVKGIQVKNSTEARVEAVNEASGIITINGTDSIGVLVDGADSYFTNKGTISLGMKDTGNQAIVNLDGTAKNSGIIKVSDMTKEEITAEVNKEEALEFLFDGTVEHTGLIVDKDGNALFLNEDTTVKEDTTTDILDGLAQGNGSVGVDGNITITGTGDHKVESESFNVSNGIATIKGDVVLNSDVVNMDVTGKFAVENGSSLTLENGTVNKEGTEDKTAVKVAETGALNINNMEVNADISGAGTVNVTGNNTFNGNLKGESADKKLTVNFGTPTRTFALRNSEGKTSITNFSADDGLINVEANIYSDAQLVLDVKADGTNAFGNSTGLELTGSNDRDVMFKTGNLTGKEIKLSLGDNSFINVDAITDSEIYITDGIVDNVGTKDEIVIKYNTKLFNDSLLDNMNNHASEVSNYFSADKAERKSQLDKLYSSNIYSETVRAAYDNAKLVEDTILSLDREAVVGKWTAEGKALYSKNEYDRTGLTGDYTSEIESTGLMAALKYGVNETTTAGIAFAGVKQDVDTDAGSADGDVFYLGAFADKELGNYVLTAGAGYQLGKYDADNTAAKTSDSSYDSNAFSAYVQGKYVADLEDGLTFEPKVKLGYTYIEQDDATDSYFGVKDAELSTVDAEVGFDLVKTTQLEKAKLDVTFGASYIKAMGDTDKKFEGSFKGTAGTFDVLGAELAENTIKADLTAELTQENGFFYNAGVTYRFGSDNTKDYGANLGIGYQF